MVLGVIVGSMTVKDWLELKRKYTKKGSFDIMYKNLTEIPKDIINIIIKYL
jgi:hypothetical protein